MKTETTDLSTQSNQNHRHPRKRRLEFRFKADNLFQVNPTMVHIMVDYMVRYALQEGRMMTSRIAMAPHVQQYEGVEVNETDVEEETMNARLNNVTNCIFVAASAEVIFSTTKLHESSLHTVDTFPRETTVVILDPHRTGCSEEFIQQLLEYAPQRIDYMSCNVVTQAREIQPMMECWIRLDIRSTIGPVPTNTTY